MTVYNINTPVGLLKRRPLSNVPPELQGGLLDGTAFQPLPGYDMGTLLGTVPTKGPNFPAMQPAAGLMQQVPQAPVEDKSTQASPQTVADLAAARQQAAGPSLDDRVGGLLNSPLFQIGMNLLGNSHSLNPWGTALNDTLAAQNQTQAMKLAQQKAQLEAEMGRGNLAVNQGQLALGQQRMQQEAPLMQAQTGLATAQTGAQTANTEMERQKLLMAQTQMARQNQFLDMAAGLFGNGQPQPQGQPSPAPQGQPAPTMQPGVFNPSKGQPQMQQTGTYGTPSNILDGLMQTESSGNPTAVNPTSGAMGAYQFMPSTVKMLASQGMNFDPMNPGQARDAADFYLQTLNKKNGGDWNKTLADYGGFKTQDPSGYIQKVIDNGQQAQQAPSGPVAAPGPIPVGGPGQGMKLAQAGALAGLGGVPNASGLIELGKMMQPQPVQAGGYQYDPASGKYGFMPDPYKAAETSLKTRQVANETAKTGMELGANETKRATTQADATQDYNSAVNSLDRLSQGAGELLKHPGLEANTGWTGALGLQNRIPGSQAKDASVLMENMKSKLLVNTLSDLKKASQNGASGFGQLSEKEGEELQTYIVNLDRAQSFDQMKTALGQIQDFAAKAKGNFTDRYNTLYGKGGAGVASSIGATPAPSPAAASTPAPSAMSLDDYLKAKRPKNQILSNREAVGKIGH